MNPRLSIWYGTNRFEDKDPYSSSYSYCLDNPVSLWDEKGDSTAVLNLGGVVGHSALLIQDSDGKWAYYSMNGDNIYNLSHGIVGGKPYHDLGKKKFNSPQDFLASEYNNQGTEQQILADEVNNYGFKEAYILPTTSIQDKAIEKRFKEEASKSYNLLVRQCAQVVQMSLNAGGIKTTQKEFKYLDSQTSIGIFVESAPYAPASTFNTIRHNYPQWRYVKRQ